MVIPEDGVGPGMGFRLSESHGGKEPTNPAIGELAFFGSALVESIGNDFDRKSAVFHLWFKAYNSLGDLSFQVGGLGRRSFQCISSDGFNQLPEYLFGFKVFAQRLLKLDGF